MVVKGQKINDRYQITKLIGEGGMANVYLAYDTILNRDVAVKVLRGDLADDEKFVRRFQREAISASSLVHPNIVEMYDVGEDNGNYFIVMEYVNGKTLKSLVKKRGALSLPEVMDIMLQLTSGIACAHDSYIIHRDIKPQNVMILDDGTIKITDFGIAMALNSNELTQTNSVMGSVHYLPPEQANGTGSTIKCDIYSLGILMYELLIGKVPFKGDNAVEIAIKHMKDQIPSVCKINPSIPQAVENIILKATAKNPKNRYDSVNEMYDDIKHSLSDEHKNDSRVVFRYSEQDVDESTKAIADLKNVNKVKDDVSMAKKPKKKLSKAAIITGSVCMFLTAFIVIAVIIYPILTEVPEVTVPNVAGLSVVDAENALREKGLEVNIEVKETYDNDIKEGDVIKTEPIAERTVKKGTSITLIVSLGSKQIEIENYVNQNYYEVKATLEAKGLYVIVEKKTVSDKTKYKENMIMEQSVEPGSKLIEKDTIKLIIPDIITEYPDFIGENWTIEDIETFCIEYNLTLTVVTQETTEYREGELISQSRPPKSKVVANTPLRITVAATPTSNSEESEYNE